MRPTFWFIALCLCAVSVSCGEPSPTKSKSSSSRSQDAVSQSTSVPLGKVLFVGVVSSKSHKNFFYGIIEALASAGYEVTVLSPYPPAKVVENIREIPLVSNDIASFMANPFEEGKLAPIIKVVTSGSDFCLNALGAEEYAEVLKEKFDVVFLSMFFNTCFLGHIHALNVPFVLVTPSEMIGPFSGSRIGSPKFPSFDYNPMFSFPQPMSFKHRLMSTFSEVVMSAMFGYSSYLSDSQARTRGMLAPDTPYLTDIFSNASLIIANSFRYAEHPRPYMPNILLAGGIHLKPSKPLPKDLEDWVQASGDAGFIFFSLGSAVRASDLPLETIKVLLSVFKSLRQKVLWKFNLPDVGAELPPNVRLTTWAPQQDLLGHPKIRLFITHGGLHSIQEASYHGVPIIGIPVFGDQDGNINNAVTQGWGVKLGWDEVTHDRLSAAILRIIDDPVARKKVSEVGALLKDRPTNPADDVVWWTGYILRTGGAHHLRSGALDLTWYELYNIDVWAVVVLVVLVGLWVDYKILRVLYRRCCGTPAKIAAEKQKLK